MSEYNVGSLNFTELLLLDGSCRPEVQKIIDSAKHQQLIVQALPSDMDAQLAKCIASIIQSVERNFELNIRTGWKSEASYDSRCASCKKSPGYAVYTRDGRYARKGAINREKPKSWLVAEYNNIRLCTGCSALARPVLQEILRDIPAVYPIKFFGEEYKPEFVCYESAECTKCNWTGHEGQMTRRQTIMDFGTYPAGCPECKAENLPFGHTVVKRSSAHRFLVEIVSGEVVRETA